MNQSEIEQQFKSPHHLIKRAEKHLSDLASEIREWSKKDTFDLLTEALDDHSRFRYILRLKENIPNNFSVIAFDIASALRASLDQAVYACIKCFGRVNNPRKTHFPFAPDAQQVLVALRTGQSKDVPAEIQPLLCGFEPHAGGNTSLWALNQMRNMKSHRFLLEPSVSTNGVHMIPRIPADATEWSTPGEISVRVGGWQEDLDGIEILQSSYYIGPYYDLDIVVDVAIGDLEPLRGIPAVKVFRDLILEVRRIVSEIEAETVKHRGP